MQKIRHLTAIMLAFLILLTACSGSNDTEELNSVVVEDDSTVVTEDVSSDASSDEEMDEASSSSGDGDEEVTVVEIEVDDRLRATYLGVVDYGYVNTAQKDSFQYRFDTEDGEVVLTIGYDEDYTIQNLLQVGYEYLLEMEDDVILSAEMVSEETTSYTAPVSGTAGVKSLKNLLATALEPVGVTLYIYGGAWNWQDDGSSVQATSIGLASSWVSFFMDEDADYEYDAEDPAASVYPYGAFNQYYYAGADCSGYMGWVLYNLVNTEDGEEGYVQKSTMIALSLSDLGWGSWSRDLSDGIQSGDIVSIQGHVWMCVGTCEDGSMVIIHSTPSESRTGGSGGGVQLSALNPNGDDDTDCEAYRLVTTYMSTYYPEWNERYEAVLLPYSTYTDFSTDSNAGRFRWDFESFLSDEEGFLDLSAGEILEALFSE